MTTRRSQKGPTTTGIDSVAAMLRGLGEIMDRLGLNLLAYGFRSKIDPVFPGYDTNWYLFQK